MMRAWIPMIALVAPRAVRADESQGSLGIVATWGGGVSAFSSREMQATSTVGVTWGAHVTLGSRRFLALDAVLLGSSTELGGSVVQSGSLDLQTLEAAARFNLRPVARWTPYVLAGLGLQKSELNAAVMAAPPDAMRTSDVSLTIPIGAGLHVRMGSGLVLDVRGTRRWNLGAGLVPDGTGKTSPIDAWEATAALGLEL